MAEESDQPVTVLSTRDPLLLGLAKSLLDEAGVLNVTIGENFRTPIYQLLVEIQVRQEHVEEARKILEDLEE